MADEIKYTLRINGEPLHIWQNSFSKTNRYIRYNKNGSNAPENHQTEGIIDILNQRGNITKNARLTIRSNTRIIDFVVEKTSKVAEDIVYNKIQNFLDGVPNATSTAASAQPATNDRIRHSFVVNGKQIDIYQRELGKTKRYMFIPEDLITEEQAKGICNIINNGGNIDVACSFTKFSNNYEFNWKVKESLVRAEAAVFNQFVPYLKGNMNAATSAAATQSPAAATKQQGPRTFILPITGTVIEEAKKEPTRFFFELPFYDQDAYDELYQDLEQGTYFIKWDSNVDNSANLAGFSFKEIVNASPRQTEEDLATLDKLIEEYLKKYLAQKNAPAAAPQPAPQPASVSNIGPRVADMSDVQVGDPYFMLPNTQIQVYVENIFNIPTYYFYITGQIVNSFIAHEINNRINGSLYITKGSNFLAKVKEDLYRVGFEFKTENLAQQEYLFLDIDNKLMDLGYIKPKITGNAAQPNGPKPDAVIDIEAQVDKLKTELDQLVFLRSLNSELDFEKNIEVGQKIAKVKENINELNFSKLEAKLTTDDIFDQLFEQSFTPIQHVYSNLKVTQAEEGDFFTPNGKPSELSEQLNELIRTQQFKEWFGDWQLTYMYKQAGDTDTDCSVVLTENFEPKLFYHGTGQEFSYFKFDKFPAAYFAANQAYSQWFANLHGGDKGYTIPFFLNVRNPLDLTQFGTEEIRPKDFFDYMYLQTGLDAEQLEVNPLFLNPSAPARECWVYLRNNPKMLKKLADNQVYDGIHFYETNPGVPKRELAYRTEVFITFKPEQCKIADNDRGLILMASLKSFLLEKGGKI